MVAHEIGRFQTPIQLRRDWTWEKKILGRPRITGKGR